MLSPSLVLDFTTEAGRRAARRHLTCTRAGPGAEWTPGGILRPDVPANWLRYSDSGLLVENARDNLVLDPSDLTTANWVNTGSSVAALADPIYPNAFTLTDDAANDNHSIEQGPVFNSQEAWNVGQRWAVRAGTKSTVFVSFRRVSAFSNIAWVSFDLATGQELARQETNLTNPVATLTPKPGGWYELEWSADDVSGSQTHFVTVGIAAPDGSIEYAGDGTGTIHIAAPHAEENVPQLSSFIDNAGAVVTRPQDTVHLADMGFLAPGAGTFLMDGVARRDGTGQTHLLNASVAGYDNRLFYIYQNSRWSNNAFSTHSGTAGIPDGSSYTAIIAYDAQGATVIGSGGSLATKAADFSDYTPTSLELLAHGGELRRLIYWPGRLTDSQIQELMP